MLGVLPFTPMNPILIIEDEHAVASALGAICKRLGHEARLCSSGQRGLEELGDGDFALAILDIGLPDVSGLDPSPMSAVCDGTRFGGTSWMPTFWVVCANPS